MKVFIADFDLFDIVGGGQAVYRQLIHTYPDIDFYYLNRKESPGIHRPPNAHPIPFRPTYRSAPLNGNLSDLSQPFTTYIEVFIPASNVAASIAGQEYDVIEIPDYCLFGSGLSAALRYHGVGYKRLALAMHGGNYRTKNLNWGTEGKAEIWMDMFEQWQYRIVDVRYGISPDYLSEWQNLAPFPAHFLHPLRFLPPPKPVAAPPEPTAPAINFIGRTEKRKGPDLFIELVASLPRRAYSEAAIIGPEVRDPLGVRSTELLKRQIQTAGVPVRIRPAMNAVELADLFAARTVTVTPSRYDTLNLVALQSVFAGCPTVIGAGAGACRFLAETFPGIPFTVLDTGDVRAGAAAVTELLRDYDRRRDRLVASLSAVEPLITGPSLPEIYAAQPICDHALRAQCDAWYEPMMRFFRSTVTPLRYHLNAVGIRLNNRLNTTASLPPGQQALEANLRLLWPLYQQLCYTPDNDEAQVEKKLELCWKIAAAVPVDRVRIWREIARLERLRGQTMIAAVYELRVMRAFGHDHFGDLPLTATALESNDFAHEAQVARAMFGPAVERDERCAALLEQARTDTDRPSREDFECVDDRRYPGSHRVAVIVSLYQAADKLPLFLCKLQEQTLVKCGLVEIILIDSGSPDNCYQVFQQTPLASTASVLYARTAHRETIQCAWNRGITLSRAPYLAFLGVDEILTPNCLERLAAELDADPSLDWVTGNSVVTEVDARGNRLRNIMIYDRTDYQQDFVYLDTCYLSWVGALYRRSIHDRYGYYDASFRAAGDTEFKNRVLPFIRSKAVPEMLGIFLNYPDARTTSSPRAEIEDLRAWYLHRTPSGVAYAFSDRDPAEVGRMLLTALRCRKSFLRHWSTDVDYAYSLSEFLRRLDSEAVVLPERIAALNLLDAYRQLDWQAQPTPRGALSALQRAREQVARMMQEPAVTHAVSDTPVFGIFNDNRYEQHNMVWRSDLKDWPQRVDDRHRWC